ncbi:MAG: glycosyltransferase family 1 protein [Caldilinea sp. CFX5]|nr:glycosyltransferase family 1 protein [Caldilinea sp. CFX5]
MKIIIDAHMLGQQEGGNETYIAGLLQGFEEILPQPATAITALYNPRYTGTRLSRSGLSPLVLTSNNDFRRLFMEIPSICKKWPADLLHATYNVSPFLPCPCVITVHDVIFRLYPEYFSPRVRLLLSTLLPLSMIRAKVIITDSEASKRDIIHFYPFVRNKIIIIPAAAGPIVNVEPNWQVAQQYRQKGEFILAVGTVQPRKNITRLVQAYISLRQRQLIDSKLIIVGRAQWQGSEIQKIALNSPYHQDIIFTGYLEDASVSALYRHCSVFVYPSLYEGFGLPVLEAMACGAPVITSNRSSLPEVAGEAATLVDPYSVEQLSAAIEAILGNPARREEMRQQGLRQAAQFKWSRAAAAALEVYKWVIERDDIQGRIATTRF